jgi:hypothetical protein
MKTFKLIEQLNKCLPIIIIILFSNFWVIQSYSQSNLKISVMGLDRKDSILYLYVAIRNVTNQTVSFNLNSSVINLQGENIEMKPFGYYNDSDSRGILYPKKTTVTVSPGKTIIELPSKDTTLMPMMIKFVFEVPRQFKPNKFILFTGGPSSIINISNLPLLSNPKITINNQPSDFIVTINKSFRSYEQFNENNSPQGIIKLLQKIASMSDTTAITLKTLSDGFSFSEGDIWLAISYSFKNLTQTTIELPINKIVIVPKIPNEPGQIIEPVGKLLKNECSFSNSFNEIISIPPGSSFNSIIIYKTEMWMDEFTFKIK